MPGLMNHVLFVHQFDVLRTVGCTMGSQEVGGKRHSKCVPCRIAQLFMIGLRSMTKRSKC